MVAEFNSGDTIYANTNGVCFTEKAEYYHFNTMFSAKDGEKSTSFNGYSAYLNSLDKPFMEAGLQHQLFDEAVRSLDPRMVDGKFTGKVIVTPACDDMIWGTIIDCFLSDFVMVQGTSRWKDALDTVVADSKLTMRLAPLTSSIGERFTNDGFASQDMDIIKDGVLKNFALSLYGANKTGKPRATTTATYALDVAAGSTKLEDMIKGVDKGILLNRFSGGSPGASGDISGVAKNSFLIENGKITDAIQETMVSFNILDVLKNITAISSERCTEGITTLPWCCFDGITISGK
jgi:PmbA protein